MNTLAEVFDFIHYNAFGRNVEIAFCFIALMLHLLLFRLRGASTYVSSTCLVCSPPLFLSHSHCCNLAPIPADIGRWQHPAWSHFTPIRAGRLGTKQIFFLRWLVLGAGCCPQLSCLFGDLIWIWWKNATVHMARILIPLWHSILNRQRCDIT